VSETDLLINAMNAASCGIKRSDSDGEAEFIDEEEEDDDEAEEEEEEEYKSLLRKRSSRKRSSAKSLVAKAAGGRAVNITKQADSDDEAEFIDDNDEEEEEEEEEEKSKYRLRKRSSRKRRSAKSLVAKAAGGRAFDSTDRTDFGDEAEAEFENDWDHNPLTNSSTPQLRKGQSIQHLTEPSSSESEDESEVDEEKEDQTMVSTFKEKKAHGVLYCDQCQRDRPIDNFSTMQQKELPPLPKKIMIEFPEVEPGDFRFCLVHTQGEQHNWIARLQKFATPATLAREEAEEGEVEMGRVARSTLMGGNYVELTELVDSSYKEEAAIGSSGGSREGGIENKGIRRMSDVIANITAREKGNIGDDDDDDDISGGDDDDDDNDDDEEEEEDETEDEEWEEEVTSTTTTTKKWGTKHRTGNRKSR